MENGFNFYMAGLSKAGNHVNITLVSGTTKETRIFAHWTLPLGERKKTNAVIVDGKLILTIELNRDTVKDREEPKPKPVHDDEIPF